MPALREDLKQIGELIQYLRKDRSQKWLAKATDTTAPIISNIEKGKRAIPQKKLTLFAAALGVKESALSTNKVTAMEIQDDLKEMGLAFRGLKDLPTGAKSQLVDYYRALREQYLGGESVARKTAPELAEEVFKKCGIKKAPVDLNRILSTYEIRLEHAPIASVQADGFIICSPNKEFAAIKVKPGLSNVRERFTIAHELGHYFSKDSIQTQLSCLPESPDHKAAEAFADEFAANLLMPQKWVLKKLPKKIQGVEQLKKMASLFGVSLEAMGIRLTKVHKGECAIYIADGGVISWSRLSDPLYAKVGPWPKGTTLSEETQASRIVRSGISPLAAEQTRGTFWFRQAIAGTFRESATATYGQKTLSLVWKV